MKFIDLEQIKRYQKKQELPVYSTEQGPCFYKALLENKDHIKNLDDLKFAIETGTCKGGVARFLSKIFDKVFTVEKYITNNNYTKENLGNLYNDLNKKINNIEFHINSSEDFLNNILSKYPDERFFFFLDAHVGYDTSVREELETIAKRSNRNDHIIVIDDMKDVGHGSWPSLEEFYSLFYTINKNYNVLNTKLGRDIYLIYP